MNPETLFDTSFLFVAPFWALMIFAPLWSVSKRIMRSPWVAVVPAIMYAIVLAPILGETFAAVTSPDLQVLSDLLSTPAGATLAWTHFLAFDLLVGRWIYLDSREHRINVLLMAPVLFFTIMLAPVGYLAYLLVRAVYAGARGDVRAAITDASPA